LRINSTSIARADIADNITAEIDTTTKSGTNLAGRADFVDDGSTVEFSIFFGETLTVTIEDVARLAAARRVFVLEGTELACAVAVRRARRRLGRATAGSASEGSLIGVVESSRASSAIGDSLSTSLVVEVTRRTRRRFERSSRAVVTERTLITAIESDVDGSSSGSGSKTNVASLARKTEQGVGRPVARRTSLARVVEVGAVDGGVLRNITARAENREFSARRTKGTIGALNREGRERRTVGTSRAIDRSRRVDGTVGSSRAVEGESSRFGTECTFRASQRNRGGGRAERTRWAQQAGSCASGDTATIRLESASRAAVRFSLTEVAVVTRRSWVNDTRSHTVLRTVVTIRARQAVREICGANNRVVCTNRARNNTSAALDRISETRAVRTSRAILRNDSVLRTEESRTAWSAISGVLETSCECVVGAVALFGCSERAVVAERAKTTLLASRVCRSFRVGNRVTILAQVASSAESSDCSVGAISTSGASNTLKSRVELADVVGSISTVGTFERICSSRWAVVIVDTLERFGRVLRTVEVVRASETSSLTKRRVVSTAVARSGTRRTESTITSSGTDVGRTSSLSRSTRAVETSSAHAITRGDNIAFRLAVVTGSARLTNSDVAAVLIGVEGARRASATTFAGRSSRAVTAGRTRTASGRRVVRKIRSGVVRSENAVVTR
jgi:hypothetical protein